MVRELKKMSMNFPVGFLAEIDAYAAAKGISRTTAVIWLCTQALAAEKKGE